jgi:hypothetical protein
VPSARPGITLGRFNEAYPDGIVLDVTNFLANAPLVEEDEHTIT